MPTINLKQLQSASQFGGSPYGNDSVRYFTQKTLPSGALEGGDSAAPIGQGDKVRLGILRKGYMPQDALLAVSNGMSNNVTGSIGFEYIDGIDDLTVPQNAGYFFTPGTVLSAPARIRATNNAAFPVTLPKDAFVILTTAGGANAKASRLDLVVYGVDRGAI